jgi:hypothetical protein
VDWDTGGPDELQRINLLEEQSGSEAYEPPQYILDAVADADIVVTQFCPVTKRVIDNCNALKIVGVLRAGIENVNESYLTEKNILFFHTPGRNATAVADFAVGMLLSECRNIARAHMEMKEGRWTKEFTNAGRVPDLSGKVAGVVGFGSIGRMVAKRLSAFDMEIVAYDPFVSQESAGTAARMVSLPELMSSADFITIHARLTDDTYHMINREIISMMKPTAYIINTARSGRPTSWRCTKRCATIRSPARRLTSSMWSLGEGLQAGQAAQCDGYPASGRRNRRRLDRFPPTAGHRDGQVLRDRQFKVSAQRRLCLRQYISEIISNPQTLTQTN